MRYINHFYTTSLLCVSLTAWSSTAPAQINPQEATLTLESVQIIGDRNVTDRRHAPNAKFIVTRDDLHRFGDQNIGDVLKRVPGLSVTGAGGQASEIRMRGLGNGYTQLLIDGEPVPASFSIDGLSPSLVERIEVLRSGSADLGSQGIAGTINIILKRRPTNRPLNISSSLSGTQGVGSSEIAVARSQKIDSWSYGIDLSATRERNRWPSAVVQSSRTSGGSQAYVWHTEAMENGNADTLAFSPRTQWQNKNHTFQVEALIELKRFDYAVEEKRTTAFGTSPTFDFDQIANRSRTESAKGSLTYTGQLNEIHKLDMKVSIANFTRESAGNLRGEFPAGTAVLFRRVDSTLMDSSFAFKLADRIEIAETHALAIGFESSRTRRRENRIQRDSSETDFPISDLDEDFNATVDKRAVYFQDEWTPTKQLSLYAGVRQEQLDTNVGGPTVWPIRRRSSAVTPMAQVVWKVSESSQIRLALGRTYKQPLASDLIPRRWVNNENSAANPNFEGNPALLPELSENIDIGFERYIRDEGFVGANFYRRNIRDVVLRSVLQRDGAWVAAPTNSGSAFIQGLELETKATVPTSWTLTPRIKARATLTFSSSRLKGVPGPDNQLAEQPGLSASGGADVPISGGAWTVGANLTYESGSKSRVSVTQTRDRSSSRRLDAYISWLTKYGLTLRMSVTNLLAQDSIIATTYDDGQLSQNHIERRPNHPTFRLKLEAKF